MMTSLPLHPLPSLRAEDAPGSFEIERDGFVDDAVVMAMIAPPVATRVTPRPQDLALSSSEEDFAGWQITAPAPPRVQEPAIVSKSPAPTRRATPPNIRSQATILPQRSSTGWWFAGLSGIFTSLFVAAVLLTWGNPPSETPASEVEAGRIIAVSPAVENPAPAALPSALSETSALVR